MGRPKKNRELLIGREGRNAIEQEDRARELSDGSAESKLSKFKGNIKLQDTALCETEILNGSDETEICE